MQAKICCSKCCRQTKLTRTRLGQLDQTQVSALCRKPETSYCGENQIPRHVVLKLELIASYFPYHPYACVYVARALAPAPAPVQALAPALLPKKPRRLLRRLRRCLRRRRTATTTTTVTAAAAATATPAFASPGPSPSPTGNATIAGYRHRCSYHKHYHGHYRCHHYYSRYILLGEVLGPWAKQASQENVQGGAPPAKGSQILRSMKRIRSDTYRLSCPPGRHAGRAFGTQPRNASPYPPRNAARRMCGASLQRSCVRF